MISKVGAQLVQLPQRGDDDARCGNNRGLRLPRHAGSGSHRGGDRALHAVPRHDPVSYGDDLVELDLGCGLSRIASTLRLTTPNRGELYSDQSVVFALSQRMPPSAQTIRPNLFRASRRVLRVCQLHCFRHLGRKALIECRGRAVPLL
jgi:hypothetical protein